MTLQYPRVQETHLTHKYFKQYHCESLHTYGTTVISRPPSDNQNLEEPYWTPQEVNKFSEHYCWRLRGLVNICTYWGFKGLQCFNFWSTLLWLFNNYNTFKISVTTLLTCWQLARIMTTWTFTVKFTVINSMITVKQFQYRIWEMGNSRIMEKIP